MKWVEEKEAWKQECADDVMIGQLEKCTFRPKINSSVENSGVRSSLDFYDR
jgi:hypothetical protein